MKGLESRVQHLEERQAIAASVPYLAFADQDDYRRAVQAGEVPHDVKVYVGFDVERV